MDEDGRRRKKRRKRIAIIYENSFQKYSFESRERRGMYIGGGEKPILISHVGGRGSNTEARYTLAKS